MAINEKYSRKNFTGQKFTTVDAAEFNNSEIVKSIFFQPQAPYSDVFPPDIVGVTFIDCILDNCKIPAGATLQNCPNSHIMLIDDEDCVVNEALEKIDNWENYKKIAFWRVKNG